MNTQAFVDIFKKVDNFFKKLITFPSGFSLIEHKYQTV
jgi:hypothetical protein